MSEFQKGILAIDDPRFDDARKRHDNRIKKYGIEDAEIYDVDQTGPSINSLNCGEMPILAQEKITSLLCDIKDKAAAARFESMTPDGGMVLREDVEYVEDKTEQVPVYVDDVNLPMKALNVTANSTNISEPVLENKTIEIPVSTIGINSLLKYGALAWLAKIILFK